MKRSRQFDFGKTLAQAQGGTLNGLELKKAIKIAQEFGLADIVLKLQLCIVSSQSFAGDLAPREVRDRIAQGISALSAEGHSLARTRQMLKKYGVIETVNRIAKQTSESKNFSVLCALGLKHLTAEAIVMDYPVLFSTQAVDIARKRLGMEKTQIRDGG